MEGKPLFSLTPRLQKAVVKITAQVVQMTTSENVILYGMWTHWYHQTKVARGVQRKCIFLDLAHGLVAWRLPNSFESINYVQRWTLL